VWVADGERTEELFDALPEDRYQEIVRSLRLHMRRAPTYLHTSDPELALAIARSLAAGGPLVAAQDNGQRVPRHRFLRHGN
jgi:hypothetical protein